MLKITGKEGKFQIWESFPLAIYVVIGTFVKRHQWNTRCGKEDLRHSELIEPRATGQPEVIDKGVRPCWHCAPVLATYAATAWWNVPRSSWQQPKSPGLLGFVLHRNKKNVGRSKMCKLTDYLWGPGREGYHGKIGPESGFGETEESGVLETEGQNRGPDLDEGTIFSHPKVTMPQGWSHLWYMGPPCQGVRNCSSGEAWDVLGRHPKREHRKSHPLLRKWCSMPHAAFSHSCLQPKHRERCCPADIITELPSQHCLLEVVQWCCVFPAPHRSHQPQVAKWLSE